MKHRTHYQALFRELERAHGRLDAETLTAVVGFGGGGPVSLSKMERKKTAALTFRPLTPDDLRLLHSWVQRPHVAQWWAEPRTLEDIERDYLPVATGASSTHAYIVLLDGAPVGFIQSYVVETDPAARGIDQFLADGERLGRGLGTAMVRAFVDRLFADPAVMKVQTDPSPSNERAIRCYRRAGFVDHGVVDTPDGTALLMVRVRG